MLIYSLLVIVAVVIIAVLVLLYFIPKEHNTKVLVYQGDTVFLPMSFSSLWVKTVEFSTNGPCTGELYQVACSNLTRRYNPAYYTTNTPNQVNHIYSLNNSTFVFTLESKSVNSDGRVWLFTDYELEQKVNKDYSKYDCDNPPGDTVCRCLTAKANTTRITTDGPSDEGRYYFVDRKAEDYISFYIERYYYNVSDFDNHTSIISKLNTEHTVKVDFHTQFDPTDFSTSNSCFLYDVKRQCSATADTYQYVYMTVSRREDILLWPGLVVLLVVIAFLIAFLAHAGTYRYYRKCYEERANMQMQTL